MVKFIDKSIRYRLLDLTKKQGLNYQQVLIRFVHERLLYRLSISAYKNSLFLKGGSLLFAYEKFSSRPTVDVDFLGQNISSDKKHIKDVFSNICTQPCSEDGLVFDNENILVDDIMINKENKGVRVQLTAHLDTIVQRISIDIGFGDIITPNPVQITYPALLSGIPETILLSYSLETVIAEKFHAMIVLEEENSRMKDFFDMYQIFSKQTVDSKILQSAITNTFRNRNTNLPKQVIAFTDKFAEDPTRIRFWEGFLRRIKWKEPLDFKDVTTLIRERLQPILNEING